VPIPALRIRSKVNGKPTFNRDSFGDSSRCGQAFNGVIYAGLSSVNYGALTIGRQNSLELDTLAKYDPMTLSTLNVCCIRPPEHGSTRVRLGADLLGRCRISVSYWEVFETRSGPRPKRSRRAMKLPHRRQFLHLAAGAAALPVVSQIATAQTYVRIV
jgi:hypothetical protein